MVTTNNNSEVTKILREGLKINQSVDDVPNDVGKTIVPVFVANPTPVPEIQMESGTLSDATTATLLTTHATRRTFITSMTISLAKNAANTATQFNLAATPFGKAETEIMLLRLEASTIQSMNQVIDLTIPIRLEPNTPITINTNNGTAEIDITSVVFFYEEEF